MKTEKEKKNVSITYEEFSYIKERSYMVLNLNSVVHSLRYTAKNSCQFVNDKFKDLVEMLKISNLKHVWYYYLFYQKRKIVYS